MFLTPAVTRFGTRENPSLLGRFQEGPGGSDGFLSFELFSGRSRPGAWEAKTFWPSRLLGEREFKTFLKGLTRCFSIIVPDNSTDV